MTGSPTAQGRGHYYRGLAAVIACVSIFGLIGGLNATLISLSLKSRGVSETLIGLNGAAFALGILVMSFIIPWLARRFDIRRCIAAMLVLELVAILLLPTNDSLILWFSCRIVMGMVANGIYGMSEAWLNHLATDLNRGRLMAIYISFLSFGFAIGPAIVSVTGVEGWLPFLTAAALLVICSIPLWFAESAKFEADPGGGFGVFRFFLLAPTLAFAVMIYAFNEMASSNLLPVFSVLNGLDPRIAALATSAFALGGAALQFPIGWLGDRFNRYLIMGLCAGGSGLGCLILPYVIADDFWRWILLPAWGASFTGVYTMAIALLGDRFKGHDLVTANAAIGLIWGMGSLAGPTLTGAAMDHAGANAFSYLLAATCGAFLIFMISRRLLVRYV